MFELLCICRDIGGGSLTTRSGSRYGNASLFAAGCASAGGSILGGSMQRGSRFTVASKSTPRSAFASRQGPFSTRPGVMALASSTGASVSILSPHSEGANQEKSYPGTFNSSVSNRAHTDGNVHLPEALLEESVQGVPSKSGGAQLQGGRAPASGTQSAVGRSHGALLPNEAAAAPASASMADGPSTSSSRNLASQGPLLRVRENEGTDDEELDELEQRLSPHARSRYQAGPGPGSSSLGLQIRAGFGPGGGHHVAGGGGSGSGFGRGGGGGQMAGSSSKRAVVRSMPNMMEGVSVVDNGPQFYTMSFINSWDSEFTRSELDRLHVHMLAGIYPCVQYGVPRGYEWLWSQ